MNLSEEMKGKTGWDEPITDEQVLDWADEAAKLERVARAAESVAEVERIKDIPTFANQGQAMDGYTMLAEYRARAAKLAEALKEVEHLLD